MVEEDGKLGLRVHLQVTKLSGQSLLIATFSHAVHRLAESGEINTILSIHTLMSHPER